MGTLEANEAEVVPLWTGLAPWGDGTFSPADSSITVYVPEKPNGTAIVICPGGGYNVLVKEPEGHGIARWLNEHGIVGVVLEYRLPKGKTFVPLYDAQRAIRLARFKASDWGCDPNRIGIMGFSAGGHLASTVVTLFDRENPSAPDPVNRMSSRPDFGILIYPVISFGPKGHEGSKLRLFGEDPVSQLIEYFSSEKQVTKGSPPCFLAHAMDDHVVAHDHSQMFHDALIRHGIASELLLLPSGGHGLDRYQGPMWEAWQTRSLEWLEKQDLITRE